jgi:membrane protein DedA with SNARE-associated domain
MISHDITSAIANHGVYAVFILMALDAMLPLGSELIMLYAGVLAAGAAGAAQLGVLGSHVPFGLDSYLVLVAAGTLGTLVGAIAGYALGAWAARGGADTRPRWLPVSDAGFARAHSWFQAHRRSAVLLGRVTPVMRSVVSIPAGVLRIPFRPYVLWTLPGALLWCLAFAGAGWALAGAWQSFHHGFRYADYAVVAIAAVLLAVFVARRRRVGPRSRLPRKA